MTRILSLLFGLALTLGALAAFGLAVVAHVPALGRLEVLADQFAQPLVWPTLLLAALALWRRALFPLGAALVALVLCGLSLAPNFRNAAPAAEGQTVRVYLANLWVRNTDVEAVAASIAEARPDIVVLIELGDVQAENLDRLLPAHPYRVTLPRAERPNGAARSLIASRRPLRKIAAEADGLSVVTAEADTALGPVTIVGAHLTRPWPFFHHGAQIWQAQRLAERLERLDGPVVLVGDFNAAAHSRVIRQIRAETGYAVAPAPLGTWPSGLPAPARIGIDNAFVSPELGFAGRRLGRPTGSDHSPVVLEIGRRAP